MNIVVSRLFMSGLALMFIAMPLLLVGITSENSPKRDRIGLFGLRLLIVATVPVWLAMGMLFLEVIL